jgi:hypothetical protein
MPRIASLLVLVGLSSSLWAQAPPNPPADSQLAEIAARGRGLAGYDAAAWHASDAVMALNPEKTAVQRYVARHTDAGWLVSWGRFDDTRTKFLIVYQALQKRDSDDYVVTKHDPPLEDNDYIFKAALAHELALNDFFHEVKPSRPYNISILPVTNGQWFVYAIPAQTDAAILPYGGDLRYTVSADGTKILEKRQMHKTVLEEHIGKETQLGFHTHVLSEIPEDSDLFYAMTRKAVRGEWIATKTYFYQIDPSGTYKYLGPTAEIVSLLQSGKMAIEEP